MVLGSRRSLMVEFKVFFVLGILGCLVASIFSDSDTGDSIYKLFLALMISMGFLITWGM